MSTLLKLVSTAVVLATTKPFVSKEKFVRDTSTKAKVKISGLGGNFTAWFLRRRRQSGSAYHKNFHPHPPAEKGLSGHYDH